VLLARDADKAFLPASNMKLLIGAAALAQLGGDFRYETQVRADSGIDSQGRLDGDLFLCGGGDPSLDYQHLDDLADQLKAQGLREVGGVVGDGRLFPGPAWGDGWSWDDLPWYYSMEISALSLGRNQVEVIVRPAEQPGQPVQVEVRPANDYVQVINRATTVPAGGRSTLALDRPWGHFEILVFGNLPCGSKPVSQGCSVPAPALYAATVLTAKLRERGIAVARLPRAEPVHPDSAAASPQPPRVLATVRSAPLRELLRQLNKHSDNLYAELLLRTLGQHHGGTGTVQQGREAVIAFLRGLGLDTAALRVADGSGLSRFNLVSPRLLVGVLRAMAFHPEALAFYTSLPIAGVDGNLASRMQGTPAAGNVHAKTGYLSQVSTLSGYVTTADGHLLAVSVLTNNFTCATSQMRDLQDQIFIRLAACRLGRPSRPQGRV
jgi:PBP4 family serine-type D-alanyl-D-alanine carboxypeptidase